VVTEEPRAVSANRVDVLVAVEAVQHGPITNAWIVFDRPIPTRIAVLKRRDGSTLAGWCPRWFTRAYRIKDFDVIG